jgi:ABC-2 type transport system ATP-binding protein
MEAIEYVMKLESVSLLYEKNIGIKNLTIKLPRGCVYGFLGRNGAGKSTTLQILSGVIQPHKGQISFHNEQSPFVKTSWKKRIGYVAQDPVFSHNVNGVQTAWFLSQLYPKWSNSRFIEMVSAFQLPLTRKIETYSFGMRTMLSMALAYACDPEVYILDEPTAGLDPVSRRIVLDLLKQETALGKSVIFSTHIVDDLFDNCHYLGIIDYGQMLDEGAIVKFGESKNSLEEAYFQLIKHNKPSGHVAINSH